MTIYGVALLALCSLAGMVIGEGLGYLLGVKANVGGVGFAMMLLIWSTDWMKSRGQFPPMSVGGVTFWSAMYIPIVIAMTAQQNVLGAIRGGPVAILAGAIATLVSFAMVPAIARMGRRERGTGK